MRASQLKKPSVTKISYKEKAQNGKMLGTKASGVVVSKKDEKAHPEDFKYLTKKEKSASIKPSTTKKVVIKKKSGGTMGKCKGGC